MWTSNFAVRECPQPRRGIMFCILTALWYRVLLFKNTLLCLWCIQWSLKLRVYVKYMFYTGHILSDWMSIRHYCLTQLRTVWLHMEMNFLSDNEERSFFIMRSMYTLFVVWFHSSSSIYLIILFAVISRWQFTLSSRKVHQYRITWWLWKSLAYLYLWTLQS